MLRLKPKFLVPHQAGVSPRRVLDIGVANDSYLECKAMYPLAQYHGVDIISPGVRMADGDALFLRDLEDPLSLRDLPGPYDLIVVNHVLEHIRRGEAVFAELCDLISLHGYMYVELPSIRTAYKRKRMGRYHFHDDLTHCKFYSLEVLANNAIAQGCKIISCGPISTLAKSFLSVPRAVVSAVAGGAWGGYLIHMQGKVDHIFIQRVVARGVL